MAGKFIAVQGCVLKVNNLTAVATITTPPSDKVLASSPCYAGDLSVIVNGGTIGNPPTITQSTPGNGTINAGALKVLIGNKPAVLEGDKNLIPIIADGIESSTGVTVPNAFTFIVEIQSAGQTKVQGV